ncbi:DNA circularization N-terminal domain-containing protein [Paraburkholderia youngii]|uniref:DNA circularization N-terminal domain-containing protein n=1 Tax=Paraburkholderia youngii TaxID=2782701 RepID=UPI0015912412|nr:DNA circularization N-terminal domain-containing protein [Paraburkholderia youngii]
MTDVIQPYPIKASFRGVEFETESNGDAGGRRIVTHEYPNREDWYNEDLGAAKEPIKFEGYITEPDLALKRERLLAALRQKGLGSFYHPYERAFIDVSVATWELHASKDQLGRFDLSLEMVREGGEASPLQVTNNRGLLADAAQSLNDQSIVAYLDSIASGSMTHDVREAVDGYLSTTIDWVQQARALSFIPSDFDFQGLVATVSDFTTGSFATLDVALSLVNLVQGLTSAFDQRIDQPAMTLNGVPPIDVQTSPMTNFQPASLLMQSLRDTSDITLPRVAGSSGQTQIQNAAAQAIESLISRVALGELASSMLDAPYPDRDSAMAARYDFAQRIVDAQAQAARDQRMEIHQTLTDLLRHVGEQFAAISDLLEPLDTLTGSVRRSSLSVAYDLYDDPTRAVDLIDRNGVMNGSFLPPEIQYVRDASK